MRTESLDAQQALAEGRAMPFAYVRTYSSVALGPSARCAPEVSTPEEILEARFFDGAAELRLFRDESGLRAARLVLEDGDDCIFETVSPANSRFGGVVTVCSVLAYDEDGQAARMAALLTDWKEAAKK